MRLKSILFITFLLFTAHINANNSFSIKTVVIDAGHGGKDPGASGSKTREKDIALNVALKLGEYITKNFPDVHVIYTRKTDVFLELHERAEIANQAKADLFIAVHCHASPNPDNYGTSTYVLGLHRTEANLEVAKRENAVILLEEDRDKNYEFDPNSPEGHIIMSMKQNAFLDQSIDFASKVENQFEHYSKRKSLGVKQAGFYVLYKTTMPSLLAEIGFISNPEEEKFLQSSKGQDQIANALMNAFREYKTEMEGGLTTGSPKEEAKEEAKEEPKKEPAKKPEAKNESKAENKPEAKVETVVIKSEPEPVKTSANKPTSAVVTLKNGKIIHKPIENSSGGGRGNQAPEPVEPPVVKAEVKEEPKKELKEEPKAAPKPVATEEVKVPVKAEPKPVVETKPEKKEVVVKEEPKPEPKKPAEEVKPPVTAVESHKPVLVPAHKAESGTVFKVQLFALKGEFKEYSRVSKLFDELSAEELSNGLTRYYGGDTKSFGEAKKILDVAKSAGYSSAYIVGFKDGVRMNPEQMKAFQ